MDRQVKRREPVRNPEDAKLARLAGQGDREAQRQLADRLVERVRTTVALLVPGDRDADDMVQVSLMGILKSAGSFRGESSLETWADRITVRTSLRLLRRRRRHEPADLGEQATAMTDDVRPDQTINRRRIGDHLTRHLHKLPIKQRTAVVLREVYEYSLDEIARMTATSVFTVKGRLRHGRKRLRQAMLRDPLLMEWARKREP